MWLWGNKTLDPMDVQNYVSIGQLICPIVKCMKPAHLLKFNKLKSNLAAIVNWCWLVMYNKRKWNRRFVSDILFELILTAVCRTDCSWLAVAWLEFSLACYDDINEQFNDLTVQILQTGSNHQNPNYIACPQTPDRVTLISAALSQSWLCVRPPGCSSGRFAWSRRQVGFPECRSAASL